MGSIRAALGYGGAGLQWLNSEEYVTLCGNSICFQSLSGGAQRVLLGGGNGIACFAVSAQKGLVAYAEKALSPTIHIHTTDKDFSEVGVIKHAATIEVSGMAFSMDGAQLSAVSGEPDLKLQIWDWEKRAMMASSSITRKASTVSFHPYNNKRLCTSGDGEMILWTVEEQNGTLQLLKVDVSLPGMAPHAHAWCPLGDSIYAGCLGGELVLLNAVNGKAIPSRATPDQEPSIVMATLSESHAAAILSLAVNREAVVAGGESSAIVWWLHPTGLGSPLGERNDVDCSVRGMANISIGGQHYNQVLAGSLDASIHLMEIPPSGGGETVPETLGDFHFGRVTAAGALSDGEHFATCGEDGTLRIWHIASNRLRSKRQFGTVHGSLACHELTRCLAMGSEKGIVRVINCSDLDGLPATFCSKLHTEAVTAVAFSPSASMLLSYSIDHRMFFCTVVGSVVRVLGFLTVPGPGPLLNVSWNGSEESSMIVAGVNTGELIGILPPHPGTIVSRNLEIGAKDVTVRRVKVDAVALKLVTLSGTDAPVAICYSADRKLRRFQLKKEAPFWGGLAGRTVQPDCKQSAGVKPLGSFSVSRQDRFLAVGSQDGTVQIISTQLDGTSVAVATPLHDSLTGGVSAVSFSQTGSVILSAGVDGSVFLSEGLLPHQAVQKPEVPEIGASFDLDTPDDMHQLDEIELRAKKEADRLHKDTESDRQAVRQVLGSLRKIFAECLERNKKAPELEQLSRGEFIVDRAMHAQLLSEGMEKVAVVRKGIQADTLRMKLLRERILAATQERMHVRGATLIGLRVPELEVSSYPLLPLSSSSTDSWKLKKALMLRRVEMKAQRQHFFIPGDLAYRVNLDADGQPVVDRRLTQLELQDEELLTDAASAAVTDSANVADLMYSEMDLYCCTRKVVQALIIQKQIRATKEAFNKEFAAMVDRKHKDTERLCDLNSRMEERAKELLKISTEGEALLQELGPTFDPITDDVREREDLRFTVTDDEVGVERYVSEDEKARLAAEAAAAEAQMAKNATDNSTARALTMMMGGALERPDDGATEFTVERPVWLDTDPKTWSAEQMKEYKEYEARQKLAAEEMAKKIQTVETELRTLKAAVEDICFKFDEALAALRETKQATDSRVYQMEYRVVRLYAGADIQYDYSDALEHAKLSEMEGVRIMKDKNTALLSEMRRKVEAQRERVESLAADDKAADKAFKKDFAEAEEHLQALLHLFRRRVVRHAAPGQNLAGANANGRKLDALDSMDSDTDDVDSLDPFPNAGQLDPDEPELDRSADYPPGLEEYWWEQLVKARGAKLQLETTLRREAEKLEAMQLYLQKLSRQDDQLKADIQAKGAEMTQFLADKHFHTLDLDVPITLKQGQVEADPMSDSAQGLSDAVLLYRSRVENINVVIKQKGSKKVEILTAIKDFKKGSYELEWNGRKLDREAEDLVQKTKELQLLRVTKSLQEVLKKGAETQASPQEQLKLEALLKYNAAVHNKNIMEKQRQLHKLKTGCREKQLQNYECLHHIQLMETKVSEQNRIAASQDAGEDLSPARRMKAMVTHKRLTDISKTQKEELAMLRAEVERLNLRTYPSFVEETAHSPDTVTLM